MWKWISALSAIVLATTGAASAQTITPNSPTGTTSVTLSGILTISQTTTVSCNVTLNVVVAAGGGSAMVTGGSFFGGSWQCGWLVSPTSFPWAFTPSPASRVWITPFNLDNIAGSCFGTIHTWWTNGSPGRLELDSWTIPGSPTYCTIDGTLSSSPSLTIS